MQLKKAEASSLCNLYLRRLCTRDKDPDTLWPRESIFAMYMQCVDGAVRELYSPYIDIRLDAWAFFERKENEILDLLGIERDMALEAVHKMLANTAKEDLPDATPQALGG